MIHALDAFVAARQPLDFFNRREKLAAGSITNMFTIAESMLRASTVVRL